MSVKPSRAALGPAALAERLGFKPWQVDRARREGLLPAMDRSKGWSADLADRIAAGAGPLRAQIGEVPDMGAHNAAKHFTKQFGIEVEPDTVHELGRLGHLRLADRYDEYPVYDGRSIEAFTDRAILDQAAKDGRLFTSDDAAKHLEIRRPDFDHLVRAGFVRSVMMGRSSYLRSRDAANVPLYRAADLRAVAARTEIDWEAVRATPAGHRSPLAKLPTAPKNGDPR